MQKLNKIFIQELVTSIAYFAPVSFMAIFLSRQSFSAHQIAIMLMVGSLTARGSRIILAPILDLFSVRANFIIFQFSGVVGYTLLAVSLSFEWMIIALVCIGFFYANSALLIRALFASLEIKQFQVQYAKLHVVTNIAVAFGPLIINFVFNHNSQLSMFLVAVLLVLLISYSYFVMNDVKLIKQKPWSSSFFGLLINKKLFLTYFLVIVLWFSYAQIFSLAPLLLAKSYAGQNFIWVITAINSLSIIILSIRVNRWLISIICDYDLLALSLCLIMVGFSVLVFLHNLYGLYLGVFILSLAEMIFIPTVQNIFAKFVDSTEKVAMFAINALLMAVGESSGYYYGVISGMNPTNISCYSILFIEAVLLISIFVSLFSKIR